MRVLLEGQVIRVQVSCPYLLSSCLITHLFTEDHGNLSLVVHISILDFDQGII